VSTHIHPNLKVHRAAYTPHILVPSHASCSEIPCARVSASPDSSLGASIEAALYRPALFRIPQRLTGQPACASPLPSLIQLGAAPPSDGPAKSRSAPGYSTLAVARIPPGRVSPECQTPGCQTPAEVGPLRPRWRGGVARPALPPHSTVQNAGHVSGGRIQPTPALSYVRQPPSRLTVGLTLVRTRSYCI